MKNAVLSMIQSVTSIIFPLITFPYVSHVLGVDNYGAYNFAQNFVYYFTFFAGLGISTYAIREGSRIRDERAKIEAFAADVFSINIYSTFISYTVLMIAVPKFSNYYDSILILSVQIIFTTIGRSWIFSIYEEFLFVSIRNIVCQVLALVLMFHLVKTENDLTYYCLVSVISIVISNVLNVVFSQKYCRIRFVVKPDLSHLKPIILIFSMTVSMVIYSNTDITILGFWGEDYNLGLYGVSVKLYTMIKQIIATVLTVTIPRFSYYLGQKDKKAYAQLLDTTYNSLMIILVPAICGMAVLSKAIILLISGSEYIEASTSFVLLSLSILFNLISYLLGYCVMIPNRDEKAFFKATMIGAGSNIILNFVLIPQYYQNAAAFTTLVSEAIVMAVCIKKSKKHARLSYINKSMLSVVAGTFTVFIICLVCKTFIDNYIYVLLISIIGSIMAYIGIQLILKNQYFMSLFDCILSRLKKK